LHNPVNFYIIEGTLLNFWSIYERSKYRIIGIFYYIWKKYSDFKKKQLEKERMLREVIAKQQAVIRKLEEELKKSAIQNENNRIEIENLKEMLRILKETEEQIKNAE